MSLDIQVISVPERHAVLRHLLHKLPQAQVFVDEDRKFSVWGAARRCWLRGITSGADHVLVLHDDAQPCEGFTKLAEAALKEVPGSPVAFFGSRKEIQSQERGGFVAFNTFAAGTALCLPVGLAGAFVSWVDRHIEPEWKSNSDDTRLLLWCCATGRHVYHTSPCLVEHGAVASEARHGGRNLRAAVYEESLKELRWDPRIEYVSRNPHDYLLSRGFGHLA